MAEKFNVTGEQYFGITGQVLEIIKQLRQKGGSPLNPHLVKMALQEIVEGKFRPASMLRLISGDAVLWLKASDGKAIIYNASKTFKSSIDSDFVDWKLIGPSEATVETLINVYEVIEDGTFPQIFSSLSADLDKLVLTQAQVIDFCEAHSNWLRQGGDITFFLIKEKRKYFVVIVYVSSGGLHVDVLDFKNDHVWPAKLRHRLVVPRMA
ncbi:MAG: hypothetical protein WC564_02145 [Patescibacteria group bacterium]|jgi:hypothetical protein